MRRVAVVPSGASGSGLGVAQRLLAEGHSVALVDRNGHGAADAAAELRAQGATGIGIECDVADRDAVKSAFEKARADLGAIEILVTSAGVESFTAVLDITAGDWDRLIAINLTGTFSCVQA